MDLFQGDILSLNYLTIVSCILHNTPFHHIPASMKRFIMMRRKEFHSISPEERLVCGDRLIFDAEVSRRLRSSEDEQLLTELRHGMASFAVVLGDLDMFCKHVNEHNVSDALSLIEVKKDCEVETIRFLTKVFLHIHSRSFPSLARNVHCAKKIWKVVNSLESTELLEAVWKCIGSQFCLNNFTLSRLGAIWKERGEAAVDRELFKMRYLDWRLLLKAIKMGKPYLAKKMAPLVVINKDSEMAELYRCAAGRCTQMLTLIEGLSRNRETPSPNCTAAALEGALENRDDDCLRHLVTSGYKLSACILPSTHACREDRVWHLELVHDTVRVPLSERFVLECLNYENMECLAFYAKKVKEAFLTRCEDPAFSATINSTPKKARLFRYVLDMMIAHVTKTERVITFVPFARLVLRTVVKVEGKDSWSIRGAKERERESTCDRDLIMYLKNKYSWVRERCGFPIRVGEMDMFPKQNSRRTCWKLE